MINRDDLETAKTARIRVDSLDAKPDSDGKSKNILEKGKAKNTTFLGWPPSDDDDYDIILNLLSLFKRDAEAFKDEIYILNDLHRW